MFIWPWQIIPILRKLMSDVAALNLKLDELSDALFTEIDQIESAIAAKLPPEVDLSPEIARIEALKELIKGIIPDAEPEETGVEVVEE